MKWLFAALALLPCCLTPRDDGVARLAEVLLVIFPLGWWFIPNDEAAKSQIGAATGTAKSPQIDIS